jgi:hypothetical protein
VYGVIHFSDGRAVHVYLITCKRGSSTSALDIVQSTKLVTITKRLQNHPSYQTIFSISSTYFIKMRWYLFPANTFDTGVKHALPHAQAMGKSKIWWLGDVV